MRQGFTLEEALKAVSNAESQSGRGGGGGGRGSIGGGNVGGGNVGGGNVGGAGGKREASALEREMEAALASGMSVDQVNITSTISRALHFPRVLRFFRVLHFPKALHLFRALHLLELLIF